MLVCPLTFGAVSIAADYQFSEDEISAYRDLRYYRFPQFDEWYCQALACRNSLHHDQYGTKSGGWLSVHTRWLSKRIIPRDRHWNEFLSPYP